MFILCQSAIQGNLCSLQPSPQVTALRIVESSFDLLADLYPTLLGGESQRPANADQRTDRSDQRSAQLRLPAVGPGPHGGAGHTENPPRPTGEEQDQPPVKAAQQDRTESGNQRGYHQDHSHEIATPSRFPCSVSCRWA